MLKRFSYLLLFGAFLPSVATAQYQTGWRSENYAGISSLLLNPANTGAFPLKWDLNLYDLSYAVDNNYGFLKKTNLLELLKYGGDAKFEFGPDLEPPLTSGNGTFVADFDREEKDRFVLANATILGPAVMVNFAEKHSVGAFFAGRVAFSAPDLPAPFSYYPYVDRPFFEPFAVSEFRVSAMAWTEWGLNYSYKMELEGGNQLILGATAKILNGYEAAFFSMDEPFNFSKIPNDSIAADRLHFSFGYTDSAIENQETYRLTKNGSGFGANLGVVFTAASGDDRPYLYKLGASVLDLGAINFSKNAVQHKVDTDADHKITGRDYDDLKGVEAFDDLIRRFSERVMGDSSASFVSDHFTMGLPTAVSLQAEYAFTKNVFFNLTFIQSAPLLTSTPTKASYLTLTPRFEHRWFSAALPVSIFNWEKLRVGANVRLGYLVLGTEHLGSFFGKGNLTGTDFFVALKFNPFTLRGSEGSGNNSSHKRSGKDVKCYEF